tara:strand:- start:44 stop:280 length:237 start_codon:yes stop_codon:yes gene_type:complete
MVTICPTILLNKVPGKEAIAKEAKNKPAEAFPKSAIKEILQIITPIILKKLEATAKYSSNWCLKYLENLLILKLRIFT